MSSDDERRQYEEDVAKGVAAALAARGDREQDEKPAPDVKPKRNLALFIVALVIGTVVIAYCAQLPTKPSRPEAQLAFCRVIDATRDAYSAAGDANELKREGLRKAARARRKRELAALLPDRKITRWTGEIGSITPGVEMIGATPSVNIGLGCRAVVRADLESPDAVRFFETVAVGDSILISGRFAPPISSSSEDPFREVSLTEFGGMLDPEFKFTLTEVVRPAAN